MPNLKELVDNFVCKSYEAKKIAREAKDAKESLVKMLIENGGVSDVEAEYN